jgi:DNA-directed RNA polymerase subunit beta
MIPFVEHDDANRIQMGAKMQQQSVPTLWPERPVIGTGFERYIAACSWWGQRAEMGGQVLYADGRAVTVVNSMVAPGLPASVQAAQSMPMAERGDEEAGLPEAAAAALPDGWERADLHVRSEMASSFPIDIHGSSKNALIHQSTCVAPGETVSLGDGLADSSCSVGGEAAIGKNLVVAYVPWEGYNYEDAIVLSARTVREDLLTSVNVVELEHELFGKSVISSEPLDGGEYLVNGLIPIGSWVEGNDVLASIIDREKVNGGHFRAPHDVRGRVIDVRVQNRSTTTGRSSKKLQYITVLIAMQCRVQVGDKLAGRHGNKGIVAKIVDDRDMPYLPDGTPLDVCLNPLGVPSRMNVGQIFEVILGSAARWTGNEYRVGSFDEMFAEDASRGVVFEALRKAREQTGYKWLLDPRSPGKTRMYDGRTGSPLDQPVTAGIAYILKLSHMVRDKVVARSWGKYDSITQQPKHGRKFLGGQRLGEMEVSALVGYGARATLQEMLTIKSDDLIGREDAKLAMLTNQPVTLPSGGHAEGYRTFLRELGATGFVVHEGCLEKANSLSDPTNRRSSRRRTD